MWPNFMFLLQAVWSGVGGGLIGGGVAFTNMSAPVYSLQEDPRPAWWPCKGYLFGFCALGSESDAVRQSRDGSLRHGGLWSDRVLRRSRRSTCWLEHFKKTCKEIKKCTSSTTECHTEATLFIVLVSTFSPSLS